MNSDSIEAHLGNADPVLRKLIRRVGPLGLRPDRRRTSFQSLVRAVANQQLNGKAAATILDRFIRLFPGRRFPAPGDLEGLGDETLRACGFSRAKVASIRDIAARAVSGEIPSTRAMSRLTDDEIVDRLTEARGVGRWTVEMLLIFQLGRPDVLPADDFGVRNGFRLAYGKPAMPKPGEVMAFGARWRPHRSAAAWYLWRATELDWDG
ncbi:MAG: DNA-3-methyladenine glycosylase [Limisphaerales bacterium]